MRPKVMPRAIWTAWAVCQGGIPIVGPSTSCTLSLKSDYREILQLEHPARDVVTADTYDICEFLLLLEQGQAEDRF